MSAIEDLLSRRRRDPTAGNAPHYHPPPTATIRGAERFCIDCGVASGAYGPATVLYTADDRVFVCKFCARLENSKPPSCGKDLICSTCWKEKEGVEKTLCTFCKVNLARERAEGKKAQDRPVSASEGSEAVLNKSDGTEDGRDENQENSSGTAASGALGRARSVKENIKSRVRGLGRTLTLRGRADA